MATKSKYRAATASEAAVRTYGLKSAPFEDTYHSILVRPWWQFVLIAAACFVGLNAVFAFLFFLEPGAIANARPGSYEDCFYFSIQTLATIGYGGMTPATRYAHLIVAVEALTGIFSVAVITGVTFAKFSRPKARVAFSAKIAAPTRNGVRHLQFRMANERQNMVVEATLRVLVLVIERTAEGETTRRPIDIPLVRDRTALFPLSWTAMHIVDEKSPFYGPDAIEKLRAQKGEIFLSFSGIDETFAQTLHARHRYQLDDIVWDTRFADILQIEADGTRVLDYKNFHEVVPLQPVPAGNVNAEDK